MRRPAAAAECAAFFVVGPGLVAGLVPWLLTRRPVSEPLPGSVLRRRRGADYDEYRAAVSAWWPRPRPWQQGDR